MVAIAIECGRSDFPFLPEVKQQCCKTEQKPGVKDKIA